MSQYQCGVLLAVGASSERIDTLPIITRKMQRDVNYIPLDLAATLLFTDKKSMKKMVKRGDVPYGRTRLGVILVEQADVLAYLDSGKDIEGVNGYSKPKAGRGGGRGGNGGSGFLGDIGDVFDGLGDLIP